MEYGTWGLSKVCWGKPWNNTGKRNSWTQCKVIKKNPEVVVQKVVFERRWNTDIMLSLWSTKLLCLIAPVCKSKSAKKFQRSSLANKKPFGAKPKYPNRGQRTNRWQLQMTNKLPGEMDELKLFTIGQTSKQFFADLVVNDKQFTIEMTLVLLCHNGDCHWLCHNGNWCCCATMEIATGAAVPQWKLPLVLLCHNGNWHWCCCATMEIDTGAAVSQWKLPLVLLCHNGNCHWCCCVTMEIDTGSAVSQW